jgi:transposase InsO family protein
MCQTFEVSLSGYYAWRNRPDSATQRWRQELVEAMQQIHAQMKQRYGSPRMTVELRARGFSCSENTVAQLMKTHGIQAKMSRRLLPKRSLETHRPAAANLLARDFQPAGPNQVWAADLTYLPTREGWLYLAVVEDLFSRRVVGWSMASTMESRLVVDALSMALSRRCPASGLLAHSDRGSQYTSEHYQRLLSDSGIECSMSEVGQCWDNAPVESFFGRMKCELGGTPFASREQARSEVFEYLEVFYNRIRRHSTLGYVSPEEFERMHNPTHR